jgi:1,4-dihydroxy-2-naphthoate octaprenyltransferase
VSALAALALLHAYSFPPLRLSYRGGGELLQAFGVGGVLPLTGYYAQSGRLDLPLWALAPSLLAALAGNLLTALPDVAQDARAAKRTFAVRAGETAAVACALSLLLVAFMLAHHLGGRLGPSAAAVAAAALPLALAAHAGFRGRGRDHRRVLFVLFGGAAQHGFFLAWTVALALR